MAFNPDEYLNEGMGGFDPDAYLAEKPAKDEGSGAAMTALEQYGNTATLGNLPHLQAMFEKLMPKAGADVDAQLRAQGFTIDQPERFVDSRDANIKRMARDEALNPKSALLGKGLGVVGGGLITSAAMPATAGAGLLGRAYQAGKSGAILGGLSNPGDVEGVVNPFQVGDRLKNAAIGAGTGVLAQGAIEGLGALAVPAKEWLSNAAARRATRAIGRPTPTVATQMAKSGDDLLLGRELLDEGAIPIFGTPGRIQKRIEGLSDKNWQGVEKILAQGGDDAVVDGTEAAIRILESPRLQAMRDAGETSVVKAYEEAAESLANNKGMSLKKAQEVKKTLDDLINYNKGIPDAGGIQEARFAKRTAIRDQMDEAASRLGSDKGELKAALKKQGRLEQGLKISEKEAGRQQTNDMISLKDLLMLNLSPSTAVKLAAAGVSKAGRSFGNSMLARGTNTLSKSAGKNAARLAALGSQPTALQGATAAITQGILGRNALAPNPESDILNNPDLLKMLGEDPSLIDKIFVDEKTRKALKSKLNRKPSNKNERRIKALEE